LNLNYIIYTSARHQTEGKDKFRVLIPFSRTVTPDEMVDVWAGAFLLFGEKTDQQCKDKSRGYYVPGQYEGIDNFYTWFADGHDIEPELLIELAPPRPINPVYAPTTVKTFAEGKTDATWSSLLDCPFVLNKWIDDYKQVPSGNGQHYGEMYKFMVKVAGSAVYHLYDIQPHEIVTLAQQLDNQTGSRYADRAWQKEAMNAISHVKTGARI
jgi:hypothetical protein